MAGKTNYDSKLVLKAGMSQRLSDKSLADGQALGTSDGGSMYILSGSAITSASLPDADLCAGSEFMFRVGSVHDHLLSGSGISSNSDADVFPDGATSGNTLTFTGGAVGDSVILKSDGLQYLTLASSGTLTVS